MRLLFRSSEWPRPSCAAATGCEVLNMGDTILAGLVAVLLMVYLTYALLVPERF